MKTSSEGQTKTAPGFLESSTGSNPKLVHNFHASSKVTTEIVPEYLHAESKSKTKTAHNIIKCQQKGKKK